MADSYEQLSDLEKVLQLMRQAAVEGRTEEEFGGWDFVACQLRDAQAAWLSHGCHVLRTAFPRSEALATMLTMTTNNLDKRDCSDPRDATTARGSNVDSFSVPASGDDYSEAPAVAEVEHGAAAHDEARPYNWCASKDFKLQEAIRNTSGLRLWHHKMESGGMVQALGDKWEFMLDSFLALPESVREDVQQEEVSNFDRSAYRSALEDGSRFEFHFITKAGVGTHVVGLPVNWPALALEFGLSGKPREGMVTYKTVGPGPKLFGVLPGSVWWYEDEEWFQYTPASFPDWAEFPDAPADIL